LFPSQIEALGTLGDRLAGACYWHPDFPYSSSLTGISSKDIADGYEKTAGKQWNMQIGASMSLFDVGFAALKNSSAANDKAAVAKALAGLKTVTMVGNVDFTSGPFPNVSPASIIGTQWLKAKPGSKYKFDQVITENANDRKVPVSAKLLPLS
jgi:branched-chain amino acid transport system substrate-binding protein